MVKKVKRKSVKKNTVKKTAKVKAVKKEDLLGISQEWDKLHKTDEDVKPKKKVVKAKIHDKINENDKKLMMWAGVGFFMVVISVVWVLNIKSVFNSVEAPETDSQFDWGGFRDEFSRTVEQMKEGLDEIKNQVDFPQAGQGKQTDNGMQAEEKSIRLSEENIMELKQKLENTQIYE